MRQTAPDRFEHTAVAIQPGDGCEPVRALTQAEAEQVERLRNEIAPLSLPEPWHVALAGAKHATCSSQAPSDDEHDRYFRVTRTAVAAGATFARSLEAGLVVLATEFGNERIAPGYDLIAHAIATVLRADGGRGSLPPPRDIIGPPEPFARWIRGHQVFATITQCLIYAFLTLERDTQHPNGDGESALALLAQLFAAAAAAFRLTGSFDPEAYQNLVRPSMSPPHVARGFSGLLSADHRTLVQTMTRLRPVFERVQERHAAAHQAMRDALASVYDSHRLVCATFAGATTPSLRMKGQASRSGVEQLANFKHARLRLVTASTRPRRD